MIGGGYEDVQHTKRKELISAKLLNASSINELPFFQLYVDFLSFFIYLFYFMIFLKIIISCCSDVLYLGKIFDQIRKSSISINTIPQSVPRKLYSSSGQPYTPLV